MTITTTIIPGSKKIVQWWKTSPNSSPRCNQRTQVRELIKSHQIDIKFTLLISETNNAQIDVLLNSALENSSKKVQKKKTWSPTKKTGDLDVSSQEKLATWPLLLMGGPAQLCSLSFDCCRQRDQRGAAEPQTFRKGKNPCRHSFNLQIRSKTTEGLVYRILPPPSSPVVESSQNRAPYR